MGVCGSMNGSMRWMNVCVGGGTDDVWNMDCELFCAVERMAVR